MIRKARMADAKPIHKLLISYAQQGLMLSRSLADIYEGIRDFYVFDIDEQVVGAVCLHIFWSDLAEVRSLAVDAGQEGKGLGRQLVEACLYEARSLGILRVFALTYKPVFFGKLGFHEIEKSELPQKIWRDCINCPKFPDCDEIAMSIEF
jgi:amino-acid N-acetyltransferase